jgi:hypothetical protein
LEADTQSVEAALHAHGLLEAPLVAALAPVAQAACEASQALLLAPGQPLALLPMAALPSAMPPVVAQPHLVPPVAVSTEGPLVAATAVAVAPAVVPVVAAPAPPLEVLPAVGLPVVLAPAAVPPVTVPPAPCKEVMPLLAVSMMPPPDLPRPQCNRAASYLSTGSTDSIIDALLGEDNAVEQTSAKGIERAKYMRFWRSLSSCNTPPEVVAKAAAAQAKGGKRALADLYGEWLNAGGDWGSTNFAQNKRQTASNASKGLFKLMTGDEIIAKYGDEKGNDLMRRKELSGDVEDHPDFPGEKLYKRFDAKTFEKLSKEEQETAMTFSTALDSVAAKEVHPNFELFEREAVGASSSGEQEAHQGKGKGKGKAKVQAPGEPETKPTKKVKSEADAAKVKGRALIRALNDWIVEAGLQVTALDTAPLDSGFAKSLQTSLHKHIAKFKECLNVAVENAQSSFDAAATQSLVAATDLLRQEYSRTLDLARRAVRPKAKSKSKAKAVAS